MRSYLKRTFLANIAALFIWVLVCLFILVEMLNLRGWGVAVDNAGRLRMNSQWPKSAALLYYKKACLNKENAQDYLERIEKSRKVAFKAIEDLKFGKNGSKAISSIGNPNAKRLFNEIEEGYKELFNLIDALTRSCDETFIVRVDEVSERILAKTMELTPLLARESAKEMSLLAIVIPLLVISILALSFGNFLISRKVLKSSLDEITLILRNLEKGNFSYKLSIDWLEFQPIVNLINAFKKFIEGLLKGILTGNNVTDEIVKQEGKIAEEIAPIATQIRALVRKAETVGRELTDLLSFIERSTEEMKVAISEISKNTHETANRAKLVRSSAVEMEETVLKLEKSMSKIKSITETIKDIADKTNLLALNASIEAARAGEAGKGFAVVANEVKGLAKKVADFTGEIESIVDHLSSEVKIAVEKTEKTKKMVDEVENATSTIAGAVEEQTAVTEHIVKNTIQTKEKSFALISEIEDLKTVVEKLSGVSDELKASSDILLEVASTAQVAGNLFETVDEPLSDEELENLSVQALVNLAILGHMNWKMAFLRAACRGEIPKVERDPRKCLLGRSMVFIEEKVRGTPIENTLKALYGPHDRLHGLVERFEKEVDLKERKSIQSFIEKKLLPTFEEVMKHLLDLREACKRYGCD